MQTESLPRSEGPVQLAIRMRPPWRFIDEIRRFVESFCACAPGCPEHREAQLAVAVHELVQNAVPRAGQGDVELLLDVDPNLDRVIVEVTNPCTDAEYEELRRRVERMNAQPDALVHYVETMRSAPSHVRGGLGLARIRYEGQLEISLRRDAGKVTVVAQGKLKVPPPRPPEKNAGNTPEATPCCK